ncbi:MAG: cation transporter [Oscillospiraceae bacterium]|nr:cation transporter [Oscillospiraceae bacterium]MBR7083629.1 cation transporter [Oscillospiraceae bacterium]
MDIQQNQEYHAKIAVRTAAVSIIGNLMLSVLKIVAGIFSHSSALVSDGIHSASDLISSAVVVIGVKLSAKEEDADHPYGHERLECAAAIVLSVLLLITGIFIGYQAFSDITSQNAQDLVQPGIFSLIVVILSILAKEAMYWYTRYYALRIHSGALMADAWHHRSDSLSSVGALLGILGARHGLQILDPIACLIICVFIFKAAYEIFRDAVNQMVDKACDKETESRIKECILKQDGVLSIDLLKTRTFANRIYVDLEISADGQMTLAEAHQIAHQVHDKVEQEIPDVKHIMIHVNPK